MTSTPSLSLTVSCDCLLKGANSFLEEEIARQLTLNNPKYVNAKKYGRFIGKKIKPHLVYYKKEKLHKGALRFPRGFANRAVLLCRECIGCDPEIIDNRRKLEDVDFQFRGELREYQRKAVDIALNKSFGVIEAGTGSGKTVMALAIIASRRQPSLVLVHTKELLYQWQQRAESFLGVEVGLVGDGFFTLADLTIAIVNTARKRVAELVPHFGQLVVDECHRVPSALFTDVVSQFDSYYLLGLSATAFRSNEEMTKLIYYFMGDCLHRVNQGELVATGAVLAPHVIRRITPFTYNYSGDYQQMIKALVAHEGRNRLILEDILQISQQPDSGTILVVSDRISHCNFFVEKLTAQGVQAVLLSGQLPPELRAEVVEAVLAGKVQVLVSTLQLISEGFDCPGLATLFLCTPISFEGRLLQVIGRVMRPAEGKKARVFDYVDDNISALFRSAQGRAHVLAKL